MKLSKTLKIASLAIASLIGISTLATTPTFADDPPKNDCSDICSKNCNAATSVKLAAGCEVEGEESPTSLDDGIIKIIDAIIGISGFVAVIFIIIGGINYMTSTGDAGKVQKAKMTILYAAIGLVICVLSYAIVNWVIADAIDGGKKSPDTSQQ